ncbi:hypothetical protein FAM19024_001670 [Propionibacterium freudenreichii]|uniref:hypothetical protein n=1 Tax=Propionibacterium freudenreichii TaxID=1744 RepID=UPI0024342D67|nr:hypothetical protein [Propionibacterium freudenreichii]WFF32240.1 hypothetical protein FAM19024_001670 [Propionibacterium freudenreichii]
MEQPASGQGHDEALTRLAPTTPGRAMLLESGRQALTLIARWCRNHHVGLALLPSYHCDTMALPFWLEGMRVHFVEVGANLQFDPPALGTALDDADEPALVVWSRVGAIAPDAALTTVLRRAREGGHLVVDDATHAVLDDLLPDPLRTGPLSSTSPLPTTGASATGPLPTCDFRVASLRKLVAVTDGALLWSREGITPDSPATRSGVDEELSAARSTLLTRSAALEARTPVPVSATTADLSEAPPLVADDYLAQLARSEELFDRATTPVPISHGARSQLGIFDLPRQARRRRRANRALTRELGDAPLEVLNAGRACFPLIRSAAAPAIEDALGRRGIFSPQSWPRPAYMPDTQGWPTDVVSIDCGPTTSTEKMRQIAAIITAAL